MTFLNWFMATFILLAAPMPAKASGALWVVEVAYACSPTDYSVDQELKEIRAASSIAFADAKKLFESCKVTLNQHVSRGQEEDLITEIERVPKTPGPTAIVGFSRTNTARLAALVMRDAPVLGISVGAAAANVRNLNSNFYSVATSWENQWNAIRQVLTEKKCRKITGIFNPSSFLSKLYHDRFEGSQLGEVVRTEAFKVSSLANGTDCVFFGSNYYDSVAAFEIAVKSPSIRFIVTTGDWVMAQNEIHKLKLHSSGTVEIVAASGWKDEHGRGKKLAEAIRPFGISDPSPIAPYTYDAVLFAMDYLCNGHTPTKPTTPSLVPLLTRTYSGVNETGNLISPIHLRRLTLKKETGATHGL
jgi:hypothetical protein